jgi:hypothetical protein
MPKILSPADVEQCCRSIVGTKGKLSALPVRVALAASMLHGNNWFAVCATQTSLAGVGRNGSGAGKIAARIASFGIAMHRLRSHRGYNTNEIQLNCNLVDLNHHHGRASLRLHKAIDVYYEKHPDSTPIAALLLLAIQHLGIHRSDELGRFLLPEFNLKKNKSLTGKILSEFEKLGLISVFRDPNQSLSQPFLVTPL